MLEPPLAGVGPPGVHASIRETGDHVHDAVPVDVSHGWARKALPDLAQVRLEWHIPAVSGGELRQVMGVCRQGTARQDHTREQGRENALHVTGVCAQHPKAPAAQRQSSSGPPTQARGGTGIRYRRGHRPREEPASSSPGDPHSDAWLRGSPASTSPTQRPPCVGAGAKVKLSARSPSAAVDCAAHDVLLRARVPNPVVRFAMVADRTFQSWRCPSGYHL